MGDPYADARRALEAAVLSGPGHAPARVREAVARCQDVPEELRELVERIEKHAHTVTDDDIEKLKSKYSDDQIFEIVVAASLGASMRRLDAGMRALRATEET